jgi:MOSC domain-containing protein YiiM
MQVNVSHIFTSTGHDFKGRHGKQRENHGIAQHESVECVAGRGLVGDRYFDKERGHKGQITFFDASVARQAQATFEVESFSPSVFRRNVILDGVDLNGLVGRQFEIAGIQFEGTEHCTPCYWMDQALAAGTEDFLEGKGGLRARIVTSGTLRIGEAELTLL